MRQPHDALMCPRDSFHFFSSRNKPATTLLAAAMDVYITLSVCAPEMATAIRDSTEPDICQAQKPRPAPTTNKIREINLAFMLFYRCDTPELSRQLSLLRPREKML